MADKIKELQVKISEQLKMKANNVLLASAYVPLFGWIYPYFFHKGREKLRFHGNQSMQLNLLIVLLYSIIWILEYFPITTIFFRPPDAILYPISRTVWLIGFFTYIAFSIIAAHHAFSGNLWNVPYLEKSFEKGLAFLKSLRRGSS